MLSISNQFYFTMNNQSSIQITSDQVFHEIMKHIKIDCHYIVCEKLNNGLVKLVRVSSSMQVANIFTKPLCPTSFKKMNSKLGM